MVRFRKGSCEVWGGGEGWVGTGYSGIRPGSLTTQQPTASTAAMPDQTGKSVS